MFPLVYADFNNADAAGRVRLNTVGTVEDLGRQQLVLAEGLRLTLYTDDDDAADGLRADAVVTRSAEDAAWVAVVDWAATRKTPPGQDATRAYGRAV
jgi:hypothetical protein